MKNTDIALWIGRRVEIISPGTLAHGKRGIVDRPAFNSRTQEFIGWKIYIGGQEWIYNAEDFTEVHE